VMWQSSGRSTLDMEKLFINTGPVFNSCYIWITAALKPRHVTGQLNLVSY
jgi:hypothetical protein